MRKLLFLIAFLMPTIILNADTIYFKNGRSIEGEVIEEIGNMIIVEEQFGTSGSVKSTYRSSEIERIRKAPRGYRTVETEWIDSRELEAGKTYKLSKQTPLCEHYDPVDPMGAIKRMKKIEEGFIKIIKVQMKRTIPWYQVEVKNNSKRTLDKGWINSSALISQNLTEVK